MSEPFHRQHSIILEAQKGYGQEDSGAMVGIDRLNNSEEYEQLKSVD
jgi:hypothetical protein